MGWVKPVLGACIMAVGFVYVAWEISPWTSNQIRKRPIVSLLIFMVIGSGIGAGAWWIWKNTTGKPRDRLAAPVMWVSPAPIVEGTPLSATQLNAVSPIEGVFTYDPPAGTVLSLGQHALTAMFYARDSEKYMLHTETSSILVIPASPTPSSSTSSLPEHAPPSQFPIVVGANIDWQQILHIENHGRSAITDIRMQWAVFNLDADSYLAKKLVIKNSSFTSNALPLASRIDAGKSMGFHLEKVIPYTGSFKDWNGSLPSEIGLRITFRDSQTGTKYNCFKVFSSIRGLPEPWGDNVGVYSGSPGPLWLNNLPNMIVTEMKDHLKDGSVDYECER
jgi:hypothetical protein